MLDDRARNIFALLAFPFAFYCKLFHLLQCACTPISKHTILLVCNKSWREVNQSWISSDTVIFAQCFVFISCTIKFTYIQTFFGIIVQFLPYWSKFPAVSTPWGKKLDKPTLIRTDSHSFLINNVIKPVIRVKDCGLIFWITSCIRFWNYFSLWRSICSICSLFFLVSSFYRLFSNKYRFRI